MVNDRIVFTACTRRLIAMWPADQRDTTESAKLDKGRGFNDRSYFIENGDFTAPYEGQCRSGTNALLNPRPNGFACRLPTG